MINTVLLIITSLFTPHTQVLNQDQVAKLMDVSVVIRAKEDVATSEGSQIRMAGCSGTFINGNTVLTAAHCFESRPLLIWVRGPKGGSHRAALLKCDFKHDLALLTVLGPKHVSAKLAKSVRKGEAVYNVGSPLMFEFLVSEGLVSALKFKTKEFTSTYMITTAMINPGSSGGGAFNEKGELIGVNTMSLGIFGWTGISMAVDLASIKEFLR